MLIYKDESYKIVGAAFKVYNWFGPGFLEAVYQEALEIEFQRQGIPYEREKELKIQYDGVELKQTYKADFVCFVGWIYEGDAGTLEAGTREAATIDSWQVAHNLVNGYQLRTSTLVIVDARFAGVER